MATAIVGAAEPAQDLIVEARGVDKYFGRRPVLRAVNLSVHRGESVAIIGPSGAGKSTLLRCLNRLEEIDRGLICVNGVVMQRHLDDEAPFRLPTSDLRRMRAEIGIVFQQYNLFPHLSVRDNIALAPTRVLGQSRDEAYANAERWLQVVGLRHKAGSSSARLSGGEQQRVAIARALAMDPKVMLFDEVTSALDPEMTAEVLEVMRELAVRGMSMVVVTHEMGFARHVAHEVVLLVDGQVVEAGPSDQVFEDSQSPRTRSFLDAVLHARN